MGRGAAERLVLFSDAAVAIALTLLAIELPVPGGSTPYELAGAVGRGGSHYLAFPISFWSSPSTGTGTTMPCSR